MYFESALNLVWVSLGLLALASTIRASFRCGAARRRGPGWLNIVGVALIVVALFPYISATDDVVRISHWNADNHPKHPGKQSRNTDELVRLYDTIDTPIVCRISEVVFTFFFVSLVFTPLARLIDRIAPSQAGRSPPYAVSA